jgi:DNA gyrase inhibitor GyrI
MVERLAPTRADYVHSLSATPEEDAQRKILNWAKQKGLNKKTGARLFGRTIYPSEFAEPHGYEYYLTIEQDIKLPQKLEIKKIPGGLYAILKTKESDMDEGWRNLFIWVESAGYKPSDIIQEEYGWVDCGFAEQVNWQEEKPQTEQIFNLWLKLKE